MFSILFHNPANETPPGEVPWSEFLHAFSSAGFAVEKQYGSAWMFTPSAESGQRSIIFHEPHPSSKIPFHIARRHGRRLERVYGWTGKTFVNLHSVHSVFDLNHLFELSSKYIYLRPTKCCRFTDQPWLTFIHSYYPRGYVLSVRVTSCMSPNFLYFRFAGFRLFFYPYFIVLICLLR